MLRRIEATDLNGYDYEWIVNTLKTKLSLFDYITEEEFVKNLHKDNYLIFISDYALFFCEFEEHLSGLKTVSVNTIAYREDLLLLNRENPFLHYKKCLSAIEGIAKDLGVDRVILEGRIGWMKVFPEYNLQSITMSKNL